MDWDVIAPMIVLVTGLLVTGGVMILRPISKRLGDLISVIAQQKQATLAGQDVAQLRELLASVDARLALLEERQSFAEALLSRDGAPAALPRPEGERVTR